MLNDQVTVRLFKAEEWELYKAVRLKALLSDSAVFGSSYEKEAAYPDQQWQDNLANPKSAVFGVYFESEVIGISGIAVKNDETDACYAVFWGLWLEQKWRRKGISQKMYQASFAWVKQRPFISRVIISHRESNLASLKSHQKYGFSLLRTEDHVWNDGLHEAHHFYELEL